MKTKIIKYDNYNNRDKSKYALLEFVLKLVVYSLILLMASGLFKGFYIDGFWYGLLVSLIITILNVTIKPFLIMLTLPMTIWTLGLFYPFINVIILKLTSALFGTHFVVEGLIVPFFIAIFISIMNLILNFLIIKPIMERTN